MGRIPVGGLGRASRLFSLRLLGLLLTALSAVPCDASCNQIPGTSNTLRGALGRVDRPFAGPGRFVSIDLSAKCDTASSGFSAIAGEHVVSVVFKPPTGPHNLVVLAADCGAVAAGLDACAERPDVDRVFCVPDEADGGNFEIEERDGQRRLRFRFPDTDALLAAPNDGLGLTGPAAIAVSRRGDPLPCELASTSCAEREGLIACVDELYRTDGSCGRAPHEQFTHFTALPPANDYSALCIDPPALCRPSDGAFHLAVDAGGNVLVPMDWRGMIDPNNLPVARLVRARLSVEAFPGSGERLRVPRSAFLFSFSNEGGLLPPIFEPQIAPTGESDLTLFGSVDAPETVLFLARRGPLFRECQGGADAGRPCLGSGDCTGGECAVASCRGGEADGDPCEADAGCPGGECGPSLFDFRSRVLDGVGPLVLPRFAPGFCQDSQRPCADDDNCPGSRCVAFRLTAEEPVPLEGLVELDGGLVTVVPEAIDARDLNGDGDARDEVLLLTDRRTGNRLAIGESNAPGRAATRVRQAPFTYPALASEEDLVAFLEAEPMQGDADRNGDGDRFDPILRVFRIGETGAQELTKGVDLVADAAPLVGGRSMVISRGLVFFRTYEASLATERVARASVRSDGAEANGASRRAAISANGLHVAFESEATNLTEPPSAERSEDAYVRDLERGATVPVRADAAAFPEFEGQNLRGARLSGDGRYVVGTVRERDSGIDQIVVVDRDADDDGAFDEAGAVRTVELSRGLSASPGDGPSRFPAVSADGRFVAFVSLAGNIANFVPPPGIVHWHVLLHDRDSDANGVFDEQDVNSTALDARFNLELAQVPPIFEPPTLTADGRLVAFAALDRDILPVDRNDFCVNLTTSSTTCADVIVQNRTASTAEPASFSSIGEQANNHSLTPAMSADGRFVAFLSAATNLVAGDTNGVPDVFVRDRFTATTMRVSVASDGQQADDGSLSRTIGISADGRFVVFQSLARNLVAGDSNDSCDNDLDGEANENCADIFVHDRLTGFTRRVSEALGGGAAGGASLQPTISADATAVAFESTAGDLVDGDANDFCDVDRDGAATENCSDVFVARPDEDDLGADLTGDGDLDDTLLRVLDTRRAGEPPLDVGPATRVAVASHRAAFLMPEAALGIDRNGDGDAADEVVHLYDPASDRGAARNLRRAASDVAVSLAIVAALVPESAEGDRDRNGDGDRLDATVQVAPLSDPEAWIDTRQAAEGLAVAGSLVAFLADEAAQAADMNGDGDTIDRVVQLFDAATRSLAAIGQAAEDFVLGPRLLVFRTDESAQAATDLNGDGDVEDAVLQVYDIDRGRVLSTGQAAIPCRFSSCDPRQPYRVFGTTVKFLTFEGDQGADLTGNGDEKEIVLQAFDIARVAESEGTSAQDMRPLHARRLSVAVPRGIVVIGAVTSGVCTDSGLACASSADCASGASCHVPPGECILDLGTACDSSLPFNGCAGRGYCVPTQEPGLGSCHERQGECASDHDCKAPARCRAGAGSDVRIPDPLSPSAGGELFTATGRCLERLAMECAGDGTGEGCPLGSACVAEGSQSFCEREHGTCRSDEDCPRSAPCRRSLLVVGAADSDRDGFADPFDNCPAVANVDQADADADGVGDACAVSTVGPTATQTAVAASATPTRRAEQDDGCAIGGSDRGRGAIVLTLLLAPFLLIRRRIR